MASIAKRPLARTVANPWLSVAVVAGAIVSASLIVATFVGQGRGLGLDFNVLWRAARKPLEMVYAPDYWGPFVYLPHSLIWLRPFGVLSFWPALALWWALSLAAFSLASRSRDPLLFVSPIVVQCLVYGQTTMLLAAPVLVASRLDGWKRGALLGIVVAIKPQTVLLAPVVLLARRDWQGIAAFGAAAAASVGLSILLFGFGLWLDWFHALPMFSRILAEANLWDVVITPYGVAMRFGLNPWPVFAIFGLFAVFVAAKAKGNAVEIICLTSLLAAPYALVTDLAPLLPFLVTRLREGSGKPWAALLYATALAPFALVWGAVRAVTRQPYSPYMLQSDPAR